MTRTAVPTGTRTARQSLDNQQHSDQQVTRNSAVGRECCSMDDVAPSSPEGSRCFASASLLPSRRRAVVLAPVHAGPAAADPVARSARSAVRSRARHRSGGRSGLQSVRGRLLRALRRELDGATALDLTRAEYEALKRDSSVATSRRICRSSPTWRSRTRSRGPTACGRARAACCSGSAAPRLPGRRDRRRGDRLGHRTSQRDRIARRRAGQSRLERAGRQRRPVRTRHHVAGMIGGAGPRPRV